MVLGVVIYAASTDEKSLSEYATIEDAILDHEALDVEAAVHLFWDSKGNALEPIFTTQNKRGLVSVENGEYHLVPATGDHHAHLLEALNEILYIDKTITHRTTDEIRSSLEDAATPND